MTGYDWGGTGPRNSCACGCRMDAGFFTKTDRRYGAVKGQPRRYVNGHNPGDAGRFRRTTQRDCGEPGLTVH